MITFDRFERSLPALLDDLAAPRLPDYADDLFARTAATRQRPGWTFPERWLPMSVLTRRLAAAPRIPWRLGALVALLAIAALVAALVAGTLINPKPAPYGPAANGLIAFIDESGRVVSGNPVTGDTTVLVAGTGHIGTPVFSPDGTRIAYAQDAGNQELNMFVAESDGSRPLKLNAEPTRHPKYFGWSATGTQFLVVDAEGRMLLYDATRVSEPIDLGKDLKKSGVEIGLGYNFRSTHAFRPPAGDEILFSTYGSELFAVRPDGSGLRTVLDPDNSPLAYTRLKGAEWSPDGSQIAVLLEMREHLEWWHLYVMDADGSSLRPMGDVAANEYGDQNSVLWSPDGTRIAFQYWIHHEAGDGQDHNPIGVVDVATGRMHDVGPTVTDGYVSWQWSPDGKSILEMPGDGSNEILIVDAETGTWDTGPWLVEQPIDWQRVAP